ncbi:uncharacterized protein An01g08200 [Aspergillus niger]|uniref:Contig An01c0290, genomic contig n=2 Tax=Aspergillus niger TaxID=5061 RepID=A2Q9K6_ASPNC|nr:uncharacterized protein An01g08200 [Aspergillus niger]CAK43912.1 unnamed protein product [Aspergillus niger]
MTAVVNPVELSILVLLAGHIVIGIAPTRGIHCGCQSNPPMGLPGDFHTFQDADWWVVAASGNPQGASQSMLHCFKVGYSCCFAWITLAMPPWVILDYIPLDWLSTPTPFLSRSPHP